MTGTLATQQPVRSHFALVADKSLFSDSPYTIEYYTQGNKKVMTLKDVPLFRSGSFRDSMGDQHTYDQYHIESFVRNFDYLKSSRIFENVPARRGHRGGGFFGGNDPIEGLVGWVRTLRSENRAAPHDGQEYTYLLGDVDILDPEAQEKINLGLWINRSAEVGVHQDNNGAETAPAFLGFAFVDMSAVEGLNFSKDQNILLTMEDTVTGIQTPPVPNTNKDDMFKFSCGGNELVSPEKVQEYINTLEASNASFTAQVAAKDAELTGLREFRDSQIKAVRVDFVNSLATDGKILATAKDSQLALVETFNDAQFEMYKTSFENVPRNPLLDNHGNQNDVRPDNSGEQSKKDASFQSMVGILGDFKTLGWDNEKIKATGVYANVIKADPNFSLETLSK